MSVKALANLVCESSVRSSSNILTRELDRNLNDLKNAGVSLVNYSTPCLFTAQDAIEEKMKLLRAKDGFLQKKNIGVPECTALLYENLGNRDSGDKKFLG